MATNDGEVAGLLVIQGLSWNVVRAMGCQSLYESNAKLRNFGMYQWMIHAPSNYPFLVGTYSDKMTTKTK